MLVKKTVSILAMFLCMLVLQRYGVCATLLWEDNFDGGSWSAHWPTGNAAGHLTGTGIAVLDTGTAQDSSEYYDLTGENIYTFRIRGRFVNPGGSQDCNFGTIRKSTVLGDTVESPFIDVYGHPSPEVRMHSGDLPFGGTHDEYISVTNSWGDFHVYDFVMSATQQRVYIDDVLVAVRGYDLRKNQVGGSTPKRLNYQRVRLVGRSGGAVEVDYVQVYDGDLQEPAGALLWEDNFDGPDWTPHWVNGPNAGWFYTGPETGGATCAVFDTGAAMNSHKWCSLSNGRVYTFRSRVMIPYPLVNADDNWGTIWGYDAWDANGPPFVQIYGGFVWGHYATRIHDGGSYDSYTRVDNIWEEFHVYDFVIGQNVQKVYIDGRLVALRDYSLALSPDYHRARFVGRNGGPVVADYFQLYEGDLYEGKHTIQMDSAGWTLFGDGYTDVWATVPQPGTNVGNGTISTIRTTRGATVTEDWTVTCTSAVADGGIFSVVGSVSGAQSNYDITTGRYTSNGNQVSFVITDGTADFAPGDKFTFATNTSPLPWSDLKVKNATEEKTIADAEASGWIQGSVYWFDQVNQKFATTPDEDADMPWYRGYWLHSEVPDLTLVFTGEGTVAFSGKIINVPTVGWTLFSIGQIQSSSGTGAINSDGILWAMAPWVYPDDPYEKARFFPRVNVTNGVQTMTILDAEAAGWLGATLSWWDQATQTWKTTPGDSDWLHWDRGYWLLTYVPGLQILLP
jgi:hypothetical protein